MSIQEFATITRAPRKSVSAVTSSWCAVSFRSWTTTVQALGATMAIYQILYLFALWTLVQQCAQAFGESATLQRGFGRRSHGNIDAAFSLRRN
jgi:hypothetical protein